MRDWPHSTKPFCTRVKLVEPVSGELSSDSVTMLCQALREWCKEDQLNKHRGGDRYRRAPIQEYLLLITIQYH